MHTDKLPRYVPISEEPTCTEEYDKYSNSADEIHGTWQCTINEHNTPWEGRQLQLFMKRTKIHPHINDTVAERLRRLTRNQLGLSRVGSSPASVGYDFCSG